MKAQITQETRNVVRRPQNLAELMRYASGTLVEEIDYGPAIYLGSRDKKNISFAILDQRDNLGCLVIDQTVVGFRRGILEFHGSWDVSPFTLDQTDPLNQAKLENYKSTIRGAES